MKSYVFNVILYGCETWTLRKDRDEAFDMRVWIRTKRIKWIVRVSNEEVLNRIKEKRTLLDTIIKRMGD